jgi:hypothetical protein
VSEGCRLECSTAPFRKGVTRAYSFVLPPEFLYPVSNTHHQSEVKDIGEKRLNIGKGEVHTQDKKCDSKCIESYANTYLVSEPEFGLLAQTRSYKSFWFVTHRHLVN